MRNIAFFDLKRAHQEIRGALDGAFAAIIGRGNFIQGKALAQFEEEFAR